MQKKEVLKEISKPLWFTLLLIGMTFIFPLISAFNGFGGYSFSPADLLQNEWVIFIGIALIMFALLFQSISRVFNNMAVCMVISLVLAVAIAAALSQRVFVYNYFGDAVGNWIILAAAIIALFFLLKWALVRGCLMVTLALLAVWIFIHNVDPWDFFPSSILNGTFDDIYAFASGWLVFFILIACLILCFIMRKKDSGGLGGSRDGGQSWWDRRREKREIARAEARARAHAESIAAARGGSGAGGQGGNITFNPVINVPGGGGGNPPPRPQRPPVQPRATKPFIKLSLDKTIKAGNSIGATATWSGGTAPYEIAWFVNEVYRYDSTVSNRKSKYTEPNSFAPGEHVTIRVDVRDSNGERDTANKETVIVT